MPINPGDIVKQALEVARPATDTLSEAWQGVIGDRVAAWRLRNAARLQTKVREELDRMGLRLNLAHIPERYAFSWFEEATKQDEPEIQALFARLLAKAASGDQTAGDRRLLEIVSRLTPPDAVAVDFFFNRSAAKRMSPNDGGPVSDVEIDEYELWTAVRQAHGVDAWQSIEHLLALGVLERRVTIDRDSVFKVLSSLQTGTTGEVFPTWGSSNDLEITPLIAATSMGLALHRALSA